MKDRPTFYVARAKDDANGKRWFVFDRRTNSPVAGPYRTPGTARREAASREYDLRWPR